MSASGRLLVVATPLGNLDDCSPRARAALEAADAIAAEDTRRAGRLLQLLGIEKKKLISYFAPREEAKAKDIVERVARGQTVALVTDGGTPGVSDPGAVLVREVLASGLAIEPIPGPSAVALALSVSPFGGERFVFEGFLPAKAAARRKRLRELHEEPRTIVFYEAPHRVAGTLGDLRDAFGEDRGGTLVREATKLHEEIRHGTLGALATSFQSGAKGEITLVVEGASAAPEQVLVEARDVLAWAIAGGLSPDRAARELAEATGVARNKLSRLARETAGPSS